MESNVFESLRAAHDGNLRCWPGKNQPRIVGFSAHGIVPGAIRVPNDERKLRHHGIRDRTHHLRAILDDAAMLRPGSHHEARDILQKDERNPLLVTVHHEARRFIRRIRINHAAHLHLAFCRLHHRPLVCNDADGPSIYSRIAGDDRFAIIGFVVVDFAAIDQAGDNFVHIIRLRSLGWNDCKQFFRIV